MQIEETNRHQNFDFELIGPTGGQRKIAFQSACSGQVGLALDMWITTKHCSQRCAIYGSKPFCRWVINIFVSSAGQNALSQNIFDKERRSECSDLGQILNSKDGGEYVWQSFTPIAVEKISWSGWKQQRYWDLKICSKSKRTKSKNWQKNKNGLSL